MANEPYTSQPLRAGMEDAFYKRTNYKGEVVVSYPSTAQEASAIRAHENYSVFEIPDCEEYRILIADDPRGQYKVLLVKERKFPGINKYGEPFWAPIKGNAQTGKVIMGFDDTLKAVAYAQDWLQARVQGAIRTKLNKAAFLEKVRREAREAKEKLKRHDGPCEGPPAKDTRKAKGSTR